MGMKPRECQENARIKDKTKLKDAPSESLAGGRTAGATFCTRL
jgi:hypothetical protein